MLSISRKFSGRKLIVPLQWRMSVPILLAEFIMVYHLVTDIPAEISLEEFGSEVLRRTEETLSHYEKTQMGDRLSEDRHYRFSTPYEQVTMLHMELWNDIVIDAIKCPATIDKKFIEERSRLNIDEDALSNW